MQAEKWVVFSTFDADGLPDEPALAQLLAYRKAGFKTLVVDTSPTLSDERQRQWDNVATRWRHRENVGYDFGSYQFGLTLLLDEERVEPDRLDLLLTNDSCFGPFVPMEEIIGRFDAQPNDPDIVYGITDSIQDGYHLQSYWLYFRSAASHLALAFFPSMVTAGNRAEAIEFGELALGAYLRSRNCRLVAFSHWHETIANMSMAQGRVLSTAEFLARRVAKRWKYNRDADTQCLRWLLGYPSKMKYFNPALLFAVPLFQRGQSPFIKKSMLRDNVYRTPEIPPGLKTRGMSNSDVRRLLQAPRR